MTEFLTENRRRAYPLAREWPSGLDARWSRIFLDACVGYGDVLPDNSPVLLRAVARVNGTIHARIGHSSSDLIEVAIPNGLGRQATVFATNARYRVLLTVDGTVADSVAADTKIGTDWISILTPLALRCVSSAIRRVTAVSAYSPTECTTPVFTGSEAALRTVTGGDLLVAAYDGLDVEATSVPPLEGSVLRLSALSAPAETTAADTQIDMMLRGDACFTVETIPGAKIVNGEIVARTAGETDGKGVLGGGVIKIGTKCKPCCQCEDYQAAVDALAPGDAGARAVKELLDGAKAAYLAAVSSYEQAKAALTAAVSGYGNVHASATASVSGGVYGSSTAVGFRSRISVTLLVENMTQDTLTVSGLSFTMPNLTAIKHHWNTSGSNPLTGSAITSGLTWTLAPGDTLAVLGVYGASSASNTFTTRPTGMSVSFSGKLLAQASSHTFSVSVT